MELPASGKTGMDTGGVQGREKKYEEVEIERKEENRVEEEKSVESVEESVELPASGSYWAAVTNVKNVMDTGGVHRGEKEYEEEEIELKEENRVKEELGVEEENAVEGVELTVKLPTVRMAQAHPSTLLCRGRSPGLVPYLREIYSLILTAVLHTYTLSPGFAETITWRSCGYG